jgi:hypothetical protein
VFAEVDGAVAAAAGPRAVAGYWKVIAAISEG